MSIHNNLNYYLPDVTNIYEDIQKQIDDMISTGTIADCIIAKAASDTLKNVKLLNDYQRSENYWGRFGWGNILIRLNDKLYYITKLRTDEHDFDEYPFFGYEVIGSKKLRFKRKVDNFSHEYNACIKITWRGLDEAKYVKSKFKVIETIKQINGGLIGE